VATRNELLARLEAILDEDEFNVIKCIVFDKESVLSTAYTLRIGTNTVFSLKENAISKLCDHHIDMKV